MTELWEAIKVWPAIVQGALGSALFALIVFGGQKSAGFLAPWVANVSLERKRSRLITEMTRLRAVTAREDASRGYYAAILWLRSSRYLLKGLIWLALGLCFGTFVNALGVVGYIGCIFYLFTALDGVKGIKRTGDEDQRLAGLAIELKKLNERLDA